MIFKEFDPEGEETLLAIAQSHRFNEWMYATIRPFCTGRILEIGSGIGNLSRFFLRDGADLTVSDVRQQYRTYLREIVDEKHVLDINILHPDFNQVYQPLFRSFDTVFALNVIEHIEHDRLALINMLKFVRGHGNVIILVPSYQFLFNEIDRQLQHFRRYRLKDLVDIQPMGTEVVHKQYFNLAGIVGWYLAGSMPGKKTISVTNMKLYDSLVPLFKMIDKIIFNSAGLSNIMVYRKL